MKICARCRVDKPVIAFSKLSSSKDGLCYYCRSCSRQVCRLSYAKDKPDYKPRRKGLDIARQRTYHKQWRKDKRAIELTYERMWRLKHPEDNRLRRHRRQARLLNSKGIATSQQIKARIDYYGQRCAYCGGTFQHLDHVIPISKGGTNWPANLRPCCLTCNSRKGDQDWRLWLKII